MYISVIFRRVFLFAFSFKQKLLPIKLGLLLISFCNFFLYQSKCVVKMLKPDSLIKDYYWQSIKWWTSTRSFQVKKNLYCIGYNTLTSITLIEIDWSILHVSDLHQLIFLISWHRRLQNSHRPKRYLYLPLFQH